MGRLRYHVAESGSLLQLCLSTSVTDIAPDGNRFVLRKPRGAGQTVNDSFTGLIFVENWVQEITERVPVP